MAIFTIEIISWYHLLYSNKSAHHFYNVASRNFFGFLLNRFGAAQPMRRAYDAFRPAARPADAGGTAHDAILPVNVCRRHRSRSRTSKTVCRVFIGIWDGADLSRSLGVHEATPPNGAARTLEWMSVMRRESYGQAIGIHL